MPIYYLVLMIGKFSKYKNFSTLHLKSTYHLVEINPKDKSCTTIETCFQRIIDNNQQTTARHLRIYRQHNGMQP